MDCGLCHKYTHKHTHTHSEMSISCLHIGVTRYQHRIRSHSSHWSALDRAGLSCVCMYAWDEKRDWTVASHQPRFYSTKHVSSLAIASLLFSRIFSFPFCAPRPLLPPLSSSPSSLWTPCRFRTCQMCFPPEPLAVFLFELAPVCSPYFGPPPPPPPFLSRLLFFCHVAKLFFCLYLDSLNTLMPFSLLSYRSFPYFVHVLTFHSLDLSPRVHCISSVCRFLSSLSSLMFPSFLCSLRFLFQKSPFLPRFSTLLNCLKAVLPFNTAY